MRVHVIEPIDESAMRKLRAEAEVVAWDDPEKKDLSRADAVIVRAASVTREQILAAPGLKVIGKHGVGVNAIDLVTAKERGIPVVYTPLSNVNSVAELVFGFILATARKLRDNMEHIRRGAERIAPATLTGLEISGKSLGLVGFGNIGSRVAQIAVNGFGMEVHVYDPYMKAATAKERGVHLHETLESMLREADYISVSVPLTEATRGLIGSAQFACCKPTAVIVSTARGGVIDESALYEALARKTIYGAASDVFVQEPPTMENPLLQLPNFIGTLHIGGSTHESLVRVGNTVVDDVLAVLHGEKPLYPYAV
ncbi:Hydroxypyruvate reductase [bioreactor metagenome]|uniref:Hydroxypyruvate reductase n=1 Tax=bioreactor metagenome TaxID=1076179 RepID=A0A644SRN3_9ZZZZ|nr:hydroxyacid dehydrogenase [Desulfovibrio desulfuricans]MEA4989774.1 hydroxyacid dehydrogenase [Desulfovibrio desulfuricans]